MINLANCGNYLARIIVHVLENRYLFKVMNKKKKQNGGSKQQCSIQVKFESLKVMRAVLIPTRWSKLHKNLSSYVKLAPNLLSY